MLAYGATRPLWISINSCNAQETIEFERVMAEFYYIYSML